MKSKRILSLILAMVMVLGTFGTVFADTAAAEEVVSNGEKIDWLVEQGMVKGDETGNLMLDKEIDRASTAKMVAVALGLEAEAEGLKGIPSGFKDMTVAHWANGYANLAAGKSLMKGDENSNFMPGRDITYGEVTTILVRLVMGRDLTAAEKGTAGSWVAPYVAKATELNLFDGITVPNFEAKAIRKNVLEMFYNAIVNMEVGNFSIVKGIVLENYRVENLAKDEVVVEVIQEVQRAEFAKENRKGDQPSLVIPAKVADVEHLLGKVVDFTLDKDGKVISAKIDESYKYEVGSLQAIENELTIGGKAYTVVMDERYEQRDDRIFRTYLENKSFSYNKFATGKTYRDAKTAEFARVTTKNGKVLFIDAFNFDDIAPVKSVKSEGQIVYIYDDVRDGSEKRVDFNSRTKVVSIKGKVMNVASLTDIAPLDVVHYNESSNTVFVREDAKVEGIYEKYATTKIDDQNAVRIFVDGKEYVVGFTPKRSAVFSTNAEDFITLRYNEVSTNLRKLAKKDVILLLDMNNRVQYIGTDIVDPSFTALVVDTIRGDVRLAKADGTEVDLRATLDSYITLDGSTKQRNLNDLNAGDLVKVTASEDELVSLERLAKANDILEDAKTVTSITRDYVIVAGQRVYLNNKTNLFDIDDLFGMDIATMLAMYSGKGRAYVVGNNIVFTEMEYKASATADGVVRVLDIYNAGNTWELEVENAKGETSFHKISRANADKVQRGDIVTVKLTKNDAQDITGLEVVIEVDAPVFEIISLRYNRMVLKDKDGRTKELYLLRSAVEFGDIGVSEYVSFHLNEDGDIDVIEQKDRRDKGGVFATPDEIVVEMIEALPAPAALTLEHKPAVVAARTAYDALTSAEQALVPSTVLATLVAAEAKIAELEMPVLTVFYIDPAAVEPTVIAGTIAGYSIMIPKATMEVHFGPLTEDHVFEMTLADGQVYELKFDSGMFANWNVSPKAGVTEATLNAAVVSIKAL